MSTVETRRERALRVRRELAAVSAMKRNAPDATESSGPDPYGNSDPEPAWMQIDWSEHLSQITIDVPAAAPEMEGGNAQDTPTEGGAETIPTRVSYVDLGKGDPLIFIHGLSGSWQNWLENLPHFAKSHRVIALDLPGFGASPLPAWDNSITAYSRLILSFCGALGIEKATLIGNSMGGFIAAETAIRSAELVEKLVLVSAAGIGEADLNPRDVETFTKLASRIAPILEQFQRAGIVRPRLRKIGFSGVFHDPARLRAEALWEQTVPALGASGFGPALLNFAGYDFRDRIQEIDVPTLAVWGRNDKIVPAVHATEYMKRLGQAHLEVYDETGHLPMLERPVRFNRDLESFLSE